MPLHFYCKCDWLWLISSSHINQKIVPGASHASRCRDDVEILPSGKVDDCEGLSALSDIPGLLSGYITHPYTSLCKAGRAKGGAIRLPEQRYLIVQQLECSLVERMAGSETGYPPRASRDRSNDEALFPSRVDANNIRRRGVRYKPSHVHFRYVDPEIPRSLRESLSSRLGLYEEVRDK